MDRRTIRFQWRTPEELRTAYQRGLRHGAVIGPVQPPPELRSRVVILLELEFVPMTLQLTGEVIQSNPVASIIQVQLEPSVRRQLEAIVGAIAQPVARDRLPSPPRGRPAAAVSRPPPPSPEPLPPVDASRPTVWSVTGSDSGHYVPPARTPAPAPRRSGSTPAWQPSASSQPSLRTEARGAAQQPLRYGRDLPADALAALPGPGRRRTEALLPEPVDEWDLSEVPWRALLLRLYRRGATGVLTMQLFRENCWCYLDGGAPVHFVRDHVQPGELLGPMLMEAGHITDTTWRAALRNQKLFGTRPAEWLVRQGRLQPADLDAVFRARSERITLNLENANFGTCRLHLLPAVTEELRWPRVEVPALLFRMAAAWFDGLAPDTVQGLAESHLQHRVVPLFEERELARLPLRPSAQRLLRDQLDSHWLLLELFDFADGLDRAGVIRLVLTLERAGLVRLSPSEVQRDVRAHRERALRRSLQELERRGPFESLHGHWSSHPAELEAGYREQCAFFDLEAHRDVLDPTLQILIERGRRRVEQIWTRLSHPEGRRSARRNLVSESQLQSACEMYLKKANLEQMRRDWVLIRFLLESVEELRPGGQTGHRQLREARQGLAGLPRSSSLSHLSRVELQAMREAAHRRSS